MGESWTLFLAFVFFFGSCGESPDKDRAALSWQMMFDNDEVIQRKLDTAELRCDSDQDCSESISGRVALLNSAHRVTDELYSMGNCTAWVASAKESIMVTNRHCIPDDLVDQESCEQRMGVVFANGLRARCQKLLGSSPSPEQDSNNSSNNEVIEQYRRLDYAFFKISIQPPAGEFVIDLNGFDGNQSYTVARINPIIGGSIPAGQLGSVQCRAVEGTLLVPQFKHRFSPIVTLSDCQIHKGNSGSPVMDAEGKVKGIIYAASLPDTIRSYLHRFSSELPVYLSRLALVTNLACVPLPWLRRDLSQLPDHCFVDLSQAWTDLLIDRNLEEDVRKEFHNRVNTEVQKWNQSRRENAKFRWEIQSYVSVSPEEAMFTLVPECLYKELDLQQRYFAVQVPSWSARNRIDRLQRLQVHIERTTATPHLIEVISPREVKVTEWTGPHSGSHSFVKMKGKLPLCSEKDAEIVPGNELNSPRQL